MKGTGEPHGDASVLSSLIGQKAPAFEMPLLGGGAFDLSQHLGKRVIVLDFWATWCGPCIEAMPEVMAAVENFAPSEVMLVALNQQEASRKVEKFLGAKGWNDLTVALDDGKARAAYQITGIPSTVIIGKDGRVQMVHTGYHKGLEDDLKDDINAALKPE